MIATRPAAGPETLIGDREIAPVTMPPIAPATSPKIGGTPLALAMPKHRGRATKKTTRPAEMSEPTELLIFTSINIAHSDFNFRKCVN